MNPRAKTARFVVKLDMPDRATKTQVRDYIKDAVTSMKGCYPPEDPVRDLDNDMVEVWFFRSGGRKNAKS